MLFQPVHCLYVVVSGFGRSSGVDSVSLTPVLVPSYHCSMCC